MAGEDHQMTDGGTQRGPREEEPHGEEEAEETLPWDEQLSEPTPVLLKIYKSVLTGTRKLDLKTVLDKVPRYQDVAWRAPENNYRQDAKNSMDGTVKNWSQWTLHQLRFQLTVYHLLEEGQDVETVRTLLQQQFQLTAELFQRMTNWRRERSLPGSVVVETDVLFDKASLAKAKEQDQVNKSFFRGICTSSSLPLFSNKIITTPSANQFGRGGKAPTKGYSYRSSPPYYSTSKGRGQGVPKPHGQGDLISFPTSGMSRSYSGF